MKNEDSSKLNESIYSRKIKISFTISHTGPFDDFALFRVPTFQRENMPNKHKMI